MRYDIDEKCDEKHDNKAGTEYELRHFRDIETIALDDGNDAAAAIDQTQLPNRLAVVMLKTPQDFHDAICRLVVRGAPAIGVAAAFGMYLAAKSIASSASNAEAAGVGAGVGAGAGVAAVATNTTASAADPPNIAGGLDRFLSKLRAIKEYLFNARPTAVNLGWALERMERAAHEEAERAGAGAAHDATTRAGAANHATTRAGAGAAHDATTRAGTAHAVNRVVSRMREECVAIRDEDAEACRLIGEHGLALLKPGMGLLTHCNAGRLAATRYGTATAPIYLGHERGYEFHVFCDETRPLLQGARLTAFELMASGVDTTLLCDNMAPSAMAEGLVGAALVGCDRVAANGDAANKIGTSYVALAARHYGIPFYVFAPTSTIDLSCATGAGIRIERRAAEEVTEMWYERRMAPDGVKVYNPSFDVTPASLITAIVTERGVATPPYGESIPALMGKPNTINDYNSSNSSASRTE